MSQLETSTAAIPERVGAALAALESATAAGRLSESAATILRRWLTEPGYAAYVPKIFPLIDAGRFDELDALFWEVIPFGTGGRRGIMTEFGSATMNDRTVAESADGIAVYLQKVRKKTSISSKPACSSTR